MRSVDANEPSVSYISEMFEYNKPFAILSQVCLHLADDSDDKIHCPCNNLSMSYIPENERESRIVSIIDRCAREEYKRKQYSWYFRVCQSVACVFISQKERYRV